MRSSKKTELYNNHMLSKASGKDKLILSYGVNFETFNDLKTCGLGDQSVIIKDE